MSLNSAYHDKMEAQLKEISAKIESYKAKAAKLAADARIELEKEIEKIRPMHDQARAKLVELKTSSSERWADLRVGLDRAWSDLSAAFDRARHRAGDHPKSDS